MRTPMGTPVGTPVRPPGTMPRRPMAGLRRAVGLSRDVGLSLGPLDKTIVIAAPMRTPVRFPRPPRLPGPPGLRRLPVMPRIPMMAWGRADRWSCLNDSSLFGRSRDGRGEESDLTDERSESEDG